MRKKKTEKAHAEAKAAVEHSGQTTFETGQKSAEEMDAATEKAREEAREEASVVRPEGDPYEYKQLGDRAWARKPGGPWIEAKGRALESIVRVMAGEAPLEQIVEGEAALLDLDKDPAGAGMPDVVGQPPDTRVSDVEEAEEGEGFPQKTARLAREAAGVVTRGMTGPLANTRLGLAAEGAGQSAVGGLQEVGKAAAELPLEAHSKGLAVGRGIGKRIGEVARNTWDKYTKDYY